jgi:transcriptional regulator with XRE-family HTH domain
MMTATAIPFNGNSAAQTAPQTFVEAMDRKRLTPAALEAMRRLAVAWDLTGDQAAALLGVSISTWDRIRKGNSGTSLSQDQLMRVSALIGIFKGLHLLFADDMADRWLRLRNSGPLFANRSPIEAMVEGGIPRMIEVRRYTDALRGGL